MAIAICGSGPCGLTVAMQLQELLPSSTKITIYEMSDELGGGSAINHLCAAQMISQNVSESTVNHWFQKMEHITGFKIFEDLTETTETNERPHGWNRSTGQWKHYHCQLRQKIFLSMQQQSKGDEKVTYKVGKFLSSLSRREEGLMLDFESKSGSEQHIYSLVVLAVPAFEAQRLVRTLPNSTIPSVALEVLDCCSKNYCKIYCRTIRFKRSSNLGRQLATKFSGPEFGKNVYMEFDVSSIAGDVTLLSLGTAENHSQIAIHVHARSEHALSNLILLPWLTKWLSLNNPIDGSTAVVKKLDSTAFITVESDQECLDDGTADSDMIQCFAQSRGSAAPLSPLRECGCVVLPLTESAPSSGARAPLLVLCGDWAVGGCGSMSGALISAYKTAAIIANYIKTET